jgi:hypothetical protein
MHPRCGRSGKGVGSLEGSHCRRGTDDDRAAHHQHSPVCPPQVRLSRQNHCHARPPPRLGTRWMTRSCRCTPRQSLLTSPPTPRQ